MGKGPRETARVCGKEMGWEYPGPWVLGFELYGCFFSFFLAFSVFWGGMGWEGMLHRPRDPARVCRCSLQCDEVSMRGFGGSFWGGLRVIQGPTKVSGSCVAGFFSLGGCFLVGGEGVGVWGLDDGGEEGVGFFPFWVRSRILFCLRGLGSVYVRLMVWLVGWLIGGCTMDSVLLVLHLLKTIVVINRPVGEHVHPCVVPS